MNDDVITRWHDFYDFILKCGNSSDLETFSRQILIGLGELFDIDQSLVYFLDRSGKVVDQHLVNIDFHWSVEYLEYYSKTDDGNYDLSAREGQNQSQKLINIRDWKNEPQNEFLKYYIQP